MKTLRSLRFPLRALREKMHCTRSAQRKQLTQFIEQSPSRADFFHARVALYDVYYGENHSIVVTGRAAKKYLRSVYGLNSNEYSQVRKIFFNKSKI